ncbi:hypothetical protein ACFQ61_36360 [Streptomyces sp. NPDC056500]|uniref:hypothetical protein n=1 Tax=Streptomyces sp. NPDC056500 TaxID=3345840 RepID=UPI0036ADF907
MTAPKATVVALMWEARAVRDRGAELLEWARAQELPVQPLRRESFKAGRDRVLVITWWHAVDAAAPLPELPEPAGDLITRPVHRWRFESVSVDPA